MLLELTTISVLGFVSNNRAALSPVVQTKNGPIQGALVHVQFEQKDAGAVGVYEFTSIPFAEPPIGQLRFKKPQPKMPWSVSSNNNNNGTILDATRHQINSCIQFKDGADLGNSAATISEDCLYLNVWVPKSALDGKLNKTAAAAGGFKPRPVYFFIHGGGFVGGTSASFLHNGTIISGHQNIIVVVANYRLGPLGFAYFGKNDDAPGNVGLWDQLAALRWINENIEQFGGNKSEVTIGGESAGASSVTYHLISPYSRPFFQRAIVESGSAFPRWANQQPNVAISISDSLLSRITTRASTPVELIYCNQSVVHSTAVAQKLQCLRAVDVDTIVETFGALPGRPTPVTDGDFIPRNPRQMLRSGDFYKVPLLIGFNRDESSSSFSGFDQAVNMFESSGNLTYRDFARLAEIAVELIGGYGDESLVEAVKEHYRPSQATHDSVMQAAIQIVSDVSLICPTYYWANYTATASENAPPVFVYHFTQPLWDGDWRGAYHALELDFVFGKPFAPYAKDDGFSQDQRSFSEAIMQYWGNFIKYGDPRQIKIHSTCDPNDGASDVPLTWPAFSGNEQCPGQVAELNIGTQVYACREAVACSLKNRDCLVKGALLSN